MVKAKKKVAFKIKKAETPKKGISANLPVLVSDAKTDSKFEDLFDVQPNPDFEFDFKKDIRVRICEIVMFEKHPSFDLKHFLHVLNNHKSIKHYAYIIHDKDKYDKHFSDKNEIPTDKKIGDLIDPHYHFVIRLNTNHQISAIASWFKIAPNFISFIKAKFTDALAYLTHRNSPSRYQYDNREVVSNFNWADEIIKSKFRKARIEPHIYEIGLKIVSGEIKYKKILDYISVLELHMYKDFWSSMRKARYLKASNNINRDLKVIFISGPSNFAKTTCSKYIAESYGFCEDNGDVYISDDSSDFLGNYEYEECIILNDKNASVIPIQTYLNFLDPYTSTAIASRFYNKIITAKLLIITSTRTLEEYFYDPNFSAKKNQEDLIQFKRRCHNYIIFTKEQMFVYRFDDDQRSYLDDESGVIANNFLSLVEKHRDRKSQKEFYEKNIKALTDINSMEKFIIKTFKKPNHQESQKNPKTKKSKPKTDD